MTETKKLKRILASQRRRFEKIETPLTNLEKAWFTAPCRRDLLIECGALRILEEERKKQRTEDLWSFTKLPRVYVHPLPLYVFRHLRSKYHASAYEELEADFWSLLQPWISDRTTADNIIGGLELERDTTPPKLQFVFGDSILQTHWKPISIGSMHARHFERMWKEDKDK